MQFERDDSSIELSIPAFPIPLPPYYNTNHNSKAMYKLISPMDLLSLIN